MSKISAINVSVLSSMLLILNPTNAIAKSAEEIAKELSNPNNDLAKLTFKNQYRWYQGDLPGADDQDNYTLLFQPVFPFSLGVSESGTKETLFIRPAFPFISDQPVPEINPLTAQLDWDGHSGMGDIGFDVMYAETKKSGFLWAAGMVGTLPTATNDNIAGKQWRLGPEFLIAQMYKWGVVGIFPSHQWDVHSWGSGEDSDFNTTQIQPLLITTPGGGWQVASKPIITYDWEDDQWTVPLSMSVAKTFIAGETPIQIELELNYYVEQPDPFGPDWMVSLNFTPIVKNFVEELFK